LDILLQPFEFVFMREAFLVAIMVAIPAGLLSCFLVLKGWALMGDAISHAVLPGIVLAYIIGIPLAIGAFCAGLFCASATGYLTENSRVKEDTVMGIVFSGMFALGLVMYTSIQSDIHLDHILFGDLLGVSTADLIQTAVISLVVTLTVIIKRNDMLLHAFDEQQAQAIGLPVRLLYYGLLTMLSLTIVAALKAVGIILAIAVLIAPGAIAFLVTKSFPTMLMAAAAIAAAASLIGVYASFFIDSAPAPTIVLVLALGFGLVFLKQSWPRNRKIRAGSNGR
jgi:manganese/iron transport system permease protein